MKSRNIALDVIRCFALFCVISVHFFLNCGFYDELTAGPVMFLMHILRSFFMICVPLFMILSGYLMCRKELSAAYYFKIIRTLAIYCLASVCCMLYQNRIQDNGFSLFVLVFGTTAFSNAPYSWYIEMYIGLFVMIPFLNILYQGLVSQRRKLWLIAVFLFLTAAPSAFNIYRFGDPGWWALPSSSEDYKQLIPAWWTTLYPLTYYFIGCYLREYPIRLRSAANAALILVVALLYGLFCYYRSHGAAFVNGIWQDYIAVPTVVLAVLVFNLLLRLDYTRVPPFFARGIALVSEWSLGAYLVSWIFDEHFYGILNRNVATVAERFLWFPVIVAVVFLCSTALSAVLNVFYHFTLEKLADKIERKWFAPPAKVK